MSVEKDVLAVLDEVLKLGGRSSGFDRHTPLLGAIPEIDSMAVVGLITALEDRFGIALDDDDISGEIFSTVGALTALVEEKLAL